jgi:hypothetical protein
MARLTAEDVIEFVRPAGERPRLEDKGEHLQPIFCILQGDRWRQIWNMKRTNAQLRPRPFKMTGVSVWRELLSTGDWMVSIDIKDAYCNILLKEEDRKYQRFVFDGKVWQIKTLPFGLSQAPWAWTKFLNPLIKKWRKMGVKVIGWLDDVIFAHPDKRPPPEGTADSARRPVHDRVVPRFKNMEILLSPIEHLTSLWSWEGPS